jgi:hypothetical protein
MEPSIDDEIHSTFVVDVIVVVVVVVVVDDVVVVDVVDVIVVVDVNVARKKVRNPRLFYKNDICM